MSKVKWLCWWNYSSFRKLFGALLLSLALCFIVSFVISSLWCLIPVVIICGACGYYVRRIFPDILSDLIKEMSK